MTCSRCGTRCNGRLCRDCELVDRYDTGPVGGESNEETDNSLIYECCDCGGQYQNEGPGQCPHCGYYGARYVAEPESKSVMTDGGRTVDDYVDLDDLFHEQVERPDNCHCDDPVINSKVCLACSQAGFTRQNPEAV